MSRVDGGDGTISSSSRIVRRSRSRFGRLPRAVEVLAFAARRASIAAGAGDLPAGCLSAARFGLRAFVAAPAFEARPFAALFFDFDAPFRAALFFTALFFAARLFVALFLAALFLAALFVAAAFFATVLVLAALREPVFDERPPRFAAVRAALLAPLRAPLAFFETFFAAFAFDFFAIWQPLRPRHGPRAPA